MTAKERFEAAKPYIKGVVGGLVLAPIIAFSFGWVVTTGTMNEAVASAKIEQLAAVCANAATAHWTSENKEMAALEGWEHRDDRENLAKQFAVGLPGNEAIQDDVIDECGDLLDT
jgi:hypothetical protein